MLRRLALAAVTASATYLIPAFSGSGFAATIPSCAATTSTAEVAVLPITPVGTEQVRGIFCYAIQHGDTGFTLSYHAQVSGLRNAAELRVVAVLHPAGRLLDLRATVYQPGWLLAAEAGCGCITPAGAPHPPVGPLSGAQTTLLSGSRAGEAEVTQALDLRAAG